MFKWQVFKLTFFWQVFKLTFVFKWQVFNIDLKNDCNNYIISSSTSLKLALVLGGLSFLVLWEGFHFPFYPMHWGAWCHKVRNDNAPKEWTNKMIINLKLKLIWSTLNEMIQLLRLFLKLILWSLLQMIGRL